MAELAVVAPAEMRDCYVEQTTIVQPLSDDDIDVGRLESRSHYETGSIRNIVHIDPPGLLTGARWTEQLTVLFMMPSELTFQRVMNEAKAPASSFELMRASYVPDQQIRQIGLAVLSECQSGFPSGRLYGEALAMALAARLTSCYSNTVLDTLEDGRGLPLWRLRKVTDFIEDNLDADLSLGDLAAIAGFSEYHFSRMFKARTGQTPHRYVMERRVAKARELLARGKTPIKEISASLGFADQAHLTQVFKRLTGITPKRYREQLQ
ncbi:helix-turn-helix domain-containing protein [Novosphingobium sp. KA1]|uniref:helix-turn-helix domain-containing protein n=1 Tax=Novosphingobium sp. (strain KA1) TaxID=164608 RepID=UPI001A8EB6D2|nr:AraC family transcriptional regulator [Novosphingobium sp. KA1]